MNKAKRIRLIYGILTGLSAVVAGICLMAACISIYQSGGDQIYTAQKVAEAFSEISGLVYLAIALSIGGFILDFSLPAEKKKAKATKNYAAVLQRLMEKQDLSDAPEALLTSIQAEEKLRRRDRIISIAVLVLCSIGFLCYGANPANFHQTEINASMAKAFLILLGCMVLPFGLSLAASYRAKASLQRQIELVKQLPAGEKKAETATPACDKGVAAVRWALLCAAIVLLVYGYMAGGTADVLTKAVNICTECVGLG